MFINCTVYLHCLTVVRCGAGCVCIWRALFVFVFVFAFPLGSAPRLRAGGGGIYPAHGGRVMRLSRKNYKKVNLFEHCKQILNNRGKC